MDKRHKKDDSFEKISTQTIILTAILWNSQEIFVTARVLAIAMVLARYPKENLRIKWQISLYFLLCSKISIR